MDRREALKREQKIKNDLKGRREATSIEMF